MSDKASGVVERVSSKVVGRRSSKVYSFMLNDEVWYTCGFDDPKVAEGDSISFTYEEEEWSPGKFNNKVNINSIEKGEAVTQNKPVKEAVKKAGGKVAENWDARAKYWENKEAGDSARQNIISYQAAWNTATALVTAALNNGIEINLGKVEKNKITNLVTFVEGVAEDIFTKYLHGNDVAEDILEQEEQEVVNATPTKQNTPKGAELDD